MTVTIITDHPTHPMILALLDGLEDAQLRSYEEFLRQAPQSQVVVLDWKRTHTKFLDRIKHLQTNGYVFLPAYDTLFEHRKDREFKALLHTEDLLRYLPETMFVDSSAQLSTLANFAFEHSSGEELVLRSVSGDDGHFITLSSQSSLDQFISSVKDSDFPLIYQNRINQRSFDLRILMIHSSVVAVFIREQRSQDLVLIDQSAIEVDGELLNYIREASKMMMDIWGYPFALLDFIITPNNRAYFMESNFELSSFNFPVRYSDVFASMIINELL